ncbi:type-I signal peptidase [Staphylococcus saccharolyticus]|uniref:Signal peptidase I n=1 Tax=Staphylococcus saccharolyticus TaxID=33028 RepID=A0A380H8L0_9STAP|nr:type-I signal peptidase [Staphylococcus saccharolyticus]
MQYFIKYLISLIFAIIIILFIQTFIIKGAVIPNQSMSVTLQKFDRVIINKTKVTFDMLKRGDIIMYEYEGKIHFSRIIGEPGESVNIKNHHIYIDDRQLKEKYAQH